ncbi:peptidylprolyl isomerase [uncultured Sphingomonas sp.]|uniref:peptidylprolyl isomerase n=1 Tax=uncultured Sphingomonas sp. TaxID=158754 RepID=UPI0035CA277E
MIHEPASNENWNLARPDTRRSLLLAATGALVGLVIAGFGLFTAQGTRTASVPPEDVAVVNGVPILRVDFISQLRALDEISPGQATPAQKRAVLGDMVAEELAVQRGVELGMATDDTDTRSAMVAAMRGQLATDVLASVPTEAELQRYYAVHRARYASEGRMNLRWFVLPSGAGSQAVAAVTAIRAGQPLDQVVVSHRLRSTGKVDDGEEYYFAAALHLGPRLFAIARALKSGAVSDPVPAPQGTSILVMTDNQPPVAQAYGQALDRVREDYARDRLAAVEAANARFLRGRADVLVASDMR